MELRKWVKTKAGVGYAIGPKGKPAVALVYNENYIPAFMNAGEKFDDLGSELSKESKESLNGNHE